jgi:hypothetical protein
VEPAEAERAEDRRVPRRLRGGQQARRVYPRYGVEISVALPAGRVRSDRRRKLERYDTMIQRFEKVRLDPPIGEIDHAQGPEDF